MVDPYRLRGPLDHLGVAAEDAESKAPVALEEIAFRGLINIRGDATDNGFVDAVKKASRLDLPTAPNTVTGKPSTTRLMWLGPDEWWAVTRTGGGARLLGALNKNLKTGALHTSVTDVSDSRTCLKLSGPQARDVLSKGCSLDVHPAVFGVGQCAQTTLARVGVLIAPTSATAFEIYVLRSFAAYLWAWLQDAMAEYDIKD